MTRIISIVNQKGGVGKTTTAINLLDYLSQRNKKVLLVDLDPQANATSGLGLGPEKVSLSVYEILTGQAHPRQAIIEIKNQTFHLIPSSVDLAGGVIELVNQENREFRLLNVLEKIKEEYEYIVIDCPPSLNLLTVNGLVASKEVLIPVQAEYYALEGLGQLLNTINLIKLDLNPDLKILGAVVTMYEQRRRLAQEVWLELYRHFPGRIFRSVIPRSVALAEAPSFGKSIFDYAPRSKGAKAYSRLAKEILETK